MDRSTLRALGLVSGLGFAIAGPLVVFFMLGLWLDDRFASQPLWMLIGLLVGLVAAGATVAELMRFQRSGSAKRAGGARPTPADTDQEDDDLG